jgi:sulfite reductase beta subunit-like hemoprotein
MTDKDGLEVVAYNYCFINDFGHPVWDVGYHVPQVAVEEHGLTRIASAQAAVTAERLKWSTALDLARVKQKELESLLRQAREALLCAEYDHLIDKTIAMIDSVMGVKE